jgi:hypothetical protein
MTVASRSRFASARQPGRPNGLVEQRYRLLFFAAFLAPFFFVDFLAFLAAM